MGFDASLLERRAGWVGGAALGAALLGALLWRAAPAEAGNSLRCDSKLVGEGDSTYDVRSKCGPPDAESQRRERRTISRLVDRPCPNGIGRCAVVVEDSIEVLIDEWTYDFGTNRFIQYLTFEQGKLIHVKSGSYGNKT